MEQEHWKKIIAPIVIACILILYCLVFFVVCLFIPVPFGFRLLFGIVPLALIGVTVFVLVERISEIRSGEEDDLSQY